MYTAILDYGIFIAFLLGSTLYPLWGQFRRSRKQDETKANYVFASGQVGVFAMMLSIARGTLGVRAFLGKLYSFNRNLFHCFLPFFLASINVISPNPIQFCLRINIIILY